MQLLVGLALAAAVSFLAYGLGSLSRSGALAATGVGAVVFGAGGWSWAILLLAFFISSSLLTRLFRGRKATVNASFDKGGPRDAGQVLGNGGLPALLAGLSYFFPHELWVWTAFAASVAAVNADTWSTELGVLSSGRPRLITNLRPVEKGTSGGVSLIGVLAGTAGAALIAVLAVLLNPMAAGPVTADLWPLNSGLIITVSGLLAALFDSLLGATVQAMYYCPLDKKETERHPLHSCGMPTVQIRGWKWLRNDWVNFLCGLFGAASASLLIVVGGKVL